MLVVQCGSCYLHNNIQVPGWYARLLLLETRAWLCWNHDSEQVTPASSEWSQLCTFQDIWEHSCREASVPLHLRLSSRIVPEPGPKNASGLATAASPQPSWRHTTRASGRSQASSHTVPHPEFEYISTRPSHWCWPPTSLTIPAKMWINLDPVQKKFIFVRLKICLVYLQREALWWQACLLSLGSHGYLHSRIRKLREAEENGKIPQFRDTLCRNIVKQFEQLFS